MGPPADLTLFVRNEPSLQTVKDLKDKKISVSTVSSLTQWLVRQLSRHEGWGPDGITTVPLGARPAQISALRTGNTDGMAIDFVGGTVLQKQGIGLILLHFGTIVPDHPNEVRDFLAGWFESTDYMLKHKAETVRIATKVMNEPKAIVAADYDVVMPAFSTKGKFEPQALAVLKSSFIEMGLLPKVPDMATLYTERFFATRSSLIVAKPAAADREGRAESALDLSQRLLNHARQ
jgi:ABC-type nitrate/sulfonate/bicarbonate transport system substrate-binding protein